MAGTLPEGKGQLARACFKLATWYDDEKKRDERRVCREAAMQLRAEVEPFLRDAPFEEANFIRLCPWMLR